MVRTRARVRIPPRAPFGYGHRKRRGSSRKVARELIRIVRSCDCSVNSNTRHYTVGTDLEHFVSRAPYNWIMARTHGTRSCYTLGCRRPECIEANAAYERERLRNKQPVRRPVQIREISDVDLAWLAGLLEGEGTFILRREAATACQRERVIIRICVHMTDRDVVERVRDIVGVGTVLPRKPGKPHHKMTFQWIISAKAPTLELMRLLRPHMGERRRARIDACIKAVEENGGVHVRQRNHGESLYRDGCRCDVCYQAKSSANARRYTTRTL